MKIFKVTIWTLFTISLTYLFVSSFTVYDDTVQVRQSPKTDKALISTSTKSESVRPNVPKSSFTNLKSSISLPVPFTPQAPTANWNNPIYADACEEANLLMAAEYFSGNHSNTIAPTDALEQIKLMADWEDANFGYNKDADSKEIIQIAKKFLELKTEILNDFTKQNIKHALNENKLVLIPTDGRKLKNPNFRQPGPPYHMVLIKGYDEENFITNDPGTRNGRDYKYTFETLYEASGEWSHKTKKVELTSKTAIIVWK